MKFSYEPLETQNFWEIPISEKWVPVTVESPDVITPEDREDIIAIGALKYLSTHRLLHYRPSIIGSDDISEAQNTDPMLTTIRVPRMEMGRFALYLLMDRLSGGHSAVTRVELEGRLMARTSCAPPSLQTQ